MATENYPLRIESELMQWIREQASNENRSVNNWIETTLLTIKKEKEHANS